MVRRILVSTLFIGLLIPLTGSTHQSSTPGKEAHWVSNDCGHPRSSKDVKKLAKQAWKKPDGPSKADRRNYKIARQCASTEFQAEVRFPNIWDHYKQRFADHRKLAGLEAKCANSPTSAVIACINYASVVHSYSQAILYRIAYCESTLNPSAGNPSGASGLFQFMPSTWSATISRMRSAGHDIAGDIWSAHDQSLAAAWKMSHDGTGEWVCQ